MFTAPLGARSALWALVCRDLPPNDLLRSRLPPCPEATTPRNRYRAEDRFALRERAARHDWDWQAVKEGWIAPPWGPSEVDPYQNQKTFRNWFDTIGTDNPLPSAKALPIYKRKEFEH